MLFAMVIVCVGVVASMTLWIVEVVLLSLAIKRAELSWRAVHPLAVFSLLVVPLFWFLLFAFLLTR